MHESISRISEAMGLDLFGKAGIQIKIYQESIALRVSTHFQIYHTLNIR